MLKAPGTERLKPHVMNCFQFCINVAFKLDLRLYDKDQNGHVSYKEFIVMITLLFLMTAGRIPKRGHCITQYRSPHHPIQITAPPSASQRTTARPLRDGHDQQR
jgi:hypothetical protein